VTLREKIIHQIRAFGPMPFSRYMEHCLYDPELGYYSRHDGQFGKAGDFYTSSDVHAVFGRLLARQFEEMWRALGSPSELQILELGPGRGLFAQDVLDWSEKKFPQFFAAMRYGLAERSPVLQEKLEERFRSRLSTGKISLTSSSQPVKTSSAAPTIIFANEFFDALPFEILSSAGELRVADQNGRFVETWAPASPETLDFVDHYGVHPEPGERIEAPLVAQRYLTEAVSSLARGFLIVIDYGYARSELLAGRHRGTLMTYRKHSASPNPYAAPGEQDITAHVNFTALAAAAEQQGMQLRPLLTQSQFLLGIGEPNQFSDAFEECRLPQERAKVALQLKHLITPAGVGETFHVLVASKGVETEKAAALTGLSFARNI
jgi:SAM-dependent MidA family methyltransferase